MGIPYPGKPPIVEAQHRRPGKKGSEVKTINLKIDGMHCDGCARTIEALVSMAPGVRKTNVSFKEREARVLFDPETVSEDRLAETIRHAGFAVRKQD